MYGYNAGPPMAIPIYTVLPYCVIHIHVNVYCLGCVFFCTRFAIALPRIGRQVWRSVGWRCTAVLQCLLHRPHSHGVCQQHAKTAQSHPLHWPQSEVGMQCTCTVVYIYGIGVHALAQLVEHLPRMHYVVGSNPTQGGRLFH